MDVKKFLLLCAASNAVASSERSCRRRWWVRPVSRNNESGEYRNLVEEILNEDTEFFKTYMRMRPETFKKLLAIVEEDLTKEDTPFRIPISPAERLALTLRYIGHGDSMKLLAITYRRGHSTVCNIVHETTRILWQKLRPMYMPDLTPADLERIAEDYKSQWQYPNAVGSIDGKHVRLTCPANSGSQYFNYKGYFSMILLAMCDANYCFTAIDVGSYGRSNDAGVFRRSNLGKAIEEKQFPFPDPNEIQEHGPKIPFVIIGDEAFPLKPNLMRPFPGDSLNDQQRIYNYRHSRARRVIENAFGILARKFRIFYRPIDMDPSNAEFVVLSACILHNFLREEEGQVSTKEIVLGTGIDEDGGALEDLAPHRGNVATDGKDVRNAFMFFFNSSTGSLPFQRRMVGLND